MLSVISRIGGMNPLIYNIGLFQLIIVPAAAAAAVAVIYWLIRLIERVPAVGGYMFGISYSKIRNKFKSKII